MNLENERVSARAGRRPTVIMKEWKLQREEKYKLRLAQKIHQRMKVRPHFE
jgi:hypothetical protein